MLHPTRGLRGLAQAFAGIASALLLAAVPVQSHGQRAWQPNKTVEVVVFAAPGGGNDKSARVMQRIWKENKWLDAIVTNKIGGGGAVAYAYVSEKTGDANYIAIAQAGLITNQIIGQSTVRYTDVTPLAYVGSEPVALAVRADSPYADLKAFMTQLAREPASLSISVGSTRGAVNDLTMALLAKAAGITPTRLKILVFRGGSESVTNLLGGHIDAMVQAVNNAIPNYRAGKMRILCLSTERRADALADVPTCREAGYDAVMDGWTIFVGPKGMTPAQIAYWSELFRKSVGQNDWKQYLAANSWEPGYKDAPQTAAYLAEQYERDKALLTELGMAKK